MQHKAILTQNSVFVRFLSILIGIHPFIRTKTLLFLVCIKKGPEQLCFSALTKKSKKLGVWGKYEMTKPY